MADTGRYSTAQLQRRTVRRISLLRRFGLLCVVVLLSGCSIKLAYNNADRLIRWSIDDYIDFDRPQKTFVSGELKRILYWHRTTQLPVYADALRRLNEDIALAVGGPQAELEADFASFIETALTWGEAVELKARRSGAQVLLSLTPEQIAALPDNLEKDNQELARDEQGKSIERSQQRWAKEVRKGLQRFSGRLSDAQIQFLNEQAQHYQPEKVLWADYRRRWQMEMLGTMESWRDGVLDNQGFIDAFRQLADNREEYYGDFGPVLNHNEALGIATTAGLLVRMTPPQRERFSERLLGIVEDLDELVAEAQPEPPAPLTVSECLVPHKSCPGSPVNPLP